MKAYIAGKITGDSDYYIKESLRAEMEKVK